MLAGFVLTRPPAGLSDATIRADVAHPEQPRAWFGRPLRHIEPAHATRTAAGYCGMQPWALAVATLKLRETVLYGLGIQIHT